MSYKQIENIYLNRIVKVRDIGILVSFQVYLIFFFFNNLMFLYVQKCFIEFIFIYMK